MITPDNLTIEQLPREPADLAAGQVRFKVTAVAPSPAAVIEALVNAAHERGRRAGLRQAANEVHRESRWQLEQQMRGIISVPDPVERLMMLENLFKTWGSDPTTTTEGKNDDGSASSNT